MSADTATATLPTVQIQASAPKPQASSAAHARSGFSAVFHEILDIINPLQHIPIISTLYRHFTGDEISPVAKIAGGALFGGFIGLGLSVADVLVQEATGEDTGEHVMALLEGKSHGPGKPDPATALAAAAPPASLTPRSEKTAVADGARWFPAFPAGSIHPSAVRFASASPPPTVPGPAAVQTANTPRSASTTAHKPAQTITPVQKQAGSIPQMDQATFDALLRSFGSKAVAGIAPSGPDSSTQPRNAAGDPTDTLGAPRAAGNPSSDRASASPGAKDYDAALKAMQSALDRYQAQGGRVPLANGIPGAAAPL